MDILNILASAALRFLPLLATLAVVTFLLMFLNQHFRKRWKDNPDLQFRFQLIMLVLTMAGVLAVLIALPIDNVLRGQLLSLIGILLSAAIALSSTTFIGNILAGIMLKAIKSVRPGDFITVGELTGRVTEMDLLHTQVQTEFRDLVTVPNLFMVTQPLHVVRKSGTIVGCKLSLGYDVHHERVTEILLTAASSVGLKDAFVQVTDLGDFSISYRIAGLLEDVQSLITARSDLRKSVLDALHDAGIEIVSPNFMNTQALAEGQRFMPEQASRRVKSRAPGSRAEEVAFDVAKEAASIEELRSALESVEKELDALKEGENNDNGAARERLEGRQTQLEVELEAAKARRASGEHKT